MTFGMGTFRGLAAAGLTYFTLSYFILPSLWTHYEHHQKMQGAPKTTFSAQGIPGDPLNIVLIGEESDVVRAMVAAGWNRADPVTLKSSARIAESILINKPYLTAPLSDLFLWHRREDFSFEKSAGPSPKERHHVRFWKSPDLSENGMVWAGAATFDRSVGFSHRTGQITHHIASDVDGERDKLIQDLKDAGRVEKIYQVTGIGPILFGKNANGDGYFSDGEITLAVLTKNGTVSSELPTFLANPPGIQRKQKIWNWIRRGLQAYTEKHF